MKAREAIRLETPTGERVKRILESIESACDAKAIKAFCEVSGKVAIFKPNPCRNKERLAPGQSTAAWRSCRPGAAVLPAAQLHGAGQCPSGGRKVNVGAKRDKLSHTAVD